MVKIIEIGPDPSVVKNVICKECGAKLAYVPRDVKYTSGWDGERGVYEIKCPNCDHDQIVPAPR